MFNKQNQFLYGKTGFSKALQTASKCNDFVLDNDEEELLCSTKNNSCYNCLFRKWNEKSFECMKGAKNEQ